MVQHLTTLETTSPKFDPHITLLHPLPEQIASPSVIERLKRAVKPEKGDGEGDWMNWEVEVQRAQSGQKYYQSVLTPITPSPPLTRLRETSAEALEIDVSSLPEYFPHLSLLYGDLTTERRDELAREAQGELDKAGLRAGSSVMIGEIWLVDCAGVVGDWKVLGKVEL